MQTLAQFVWLINILCFCCAIFSRQLCSGIAILRYRVVCRQRVFSLIIGVCFRSFQA